jgi:isopentenyl-diphosphate Delta-isomerase
MEEWFDVVDENDAVTGRERRSVVHARNLLHRAVHILVFNRKGEVFLQKRSMKKDQCPGMWGTSSAGHVDSGEEYDHAAMREFREELGIESPPLKRLFKIKSCRETGYEHLWVYSCEHEGPFTLDREEIDYGAWVPATELSAIMQANPKPYTPSLVTVWNAYLSHQSAR